jgi:hypothetical protein
VHHALTVRSFTPLPLCALPGEARVRLKAARMWVMLARAQRSPRAALGALLGSAAPAFALLMEELVAAWPDPFTSYPPCAVAVSPDEAALLALLDAAQAGVPAGADALLADLLPRAERERLWTLAERAILPG